MGRRPARIPEVLHNRNFALYYTGQSLSILGDAIVPVALAFAVLDLGRGAGALGLVLAAGIAPGVLLVLVGGVVADRIERRRLMVACDLVRFGSQAAQGVLLWTGHATLLSLVLLQLVWGTAAAFFRPASTGLVAEWVESDRLQQANGLVGLSDNLAYTVGPAVAGVLIAVFSPGAALLADALTFAASAVALSLARPAVRTAATAAEASAPVLRGLAEGWQEFRSRTWLWSMVLWAATFHLLALPSVLVLGPAVAKSDLGGASAWAAIAACSGLGAVVGGVIALRYRPRYLLRATFVPLGLYGLQLVALALPARTAVVAAAALVGGVGVAMFNVYFYTALQQHIPLPVMSRVASYEWLGSIALLPVGQALVGPVAAATSVPGVLLVAGGWMLVSPVVLYLIRSARDLRAVDEAPGAAVEDAAPVPAGEPV
ncbi:MFS transporter, partial [Streptomyces sp. NRRL B-24484]|uniref:MFS transporter n=1 Tax=Streptomyces sp. NRRL B-24484 TaxID=1463833 RepID=UPI0004C15738